MKPRPKACFLPSSLMATSNRRARSQACAALAPGAQARSRRLPADFCWHCPCRSGCRTWRHSFWHGHGTRGRRTGRVCGALVAADGTKAPEMRESRSRRTSGFLFSRWTRTFLVAARITHPIAPPRLHSSRDPVCLCPATGKRGKMCKRTRPDLAVPRIRDHGLPRPRKGTACGSG